MFWWLYTIIYCKTHFLENPQMTFPSYRVAAWYSKISKFLRSKRIMSQLSNALSNVHLRPLHQNSYHFEIHKYHCQSSSLEGIICWMNHGKVSVSVVVFQSITATLVDFQIFLDFKKKRFFCGISLGSKSANLKLLNIFNGKLILL